jgi:hypothetical protein
MSGLFKASRTSNEIVLYLSPNHPTPSTVPYELQNYISDDQWVVRVPAITKTAAKYSKPMFERIWMLMTAIAMFILPALVYRVIIGSSGGLRFGDEAALRRLHLAKVVSTSMFIGVALLLFTPLIFWKFVGRRRVASMLQKWAAADRARMGANAFIPAWRVKTPGVFRDSIVLSIQLPADQVPSSFHPDAYLPSYINGPTDSSVPPSYQQDVKGGAGYSTTFGAVPLYGDEKRGFHDVQV